MTPEEVVERNAKALMDNLPEEDRDMIKLYFHTVKQTEIKQNVDYERSKGHWVIGILAFLGLSLGISGAVLVVNGMRTTSQIENARQEAQAQVTAIQKRMDTIQTRCIDQVVCDCKKSP